MADEVEMLVGVLISKDLLAPENRDAACTAVRATGVDIYPEKMVYSIGYKGSKDWLPVSGTEPCCSCSNRTHGDHQCNRCYCGICHSCWTGDSGERCTKLLSSASSSHSEESRKRKRSSQEHATTIL